MNTLATRKRLLTAQADLHRELAGLEWARWQGRWHALDRFRNNRWWLAGGAAVAGVMLFPRWRGLVRWFPAIATAWRMLK